MEGFKHQIKMILLFLDLFIVQSMEIMIYFFLYVLYFLHKKKGVCKIVSFFKINSNK